MRYDIKSIDPRDAHNLIEANPHTLLVCAYEGSKFTENDLDGAISIAEFHSRHDSIEPNWPVIFYCDCAHEEAALAEAEKYAEGGATTVRVLKGGVKAWREAGFALAHAPH